MNILLLVFLFLQSPPQAKERQAHEIKKDVEDKTDYIIKRLQEDQAKEKQKKIRDEYEEATRKRK